MFNFFSYPENSKITLKCLSLLSEVQAERGPAQEALQAAVTKTTTMEARMAVLEQLQAP